MYVKVEPTGCCERKGLIQIRFCFYLDKGDYDYNIHRVQVPDPTNPDWIRGYQGALNDTETPIDQDDYDGWYDGLPKISQGNPFHNHFIYVEPETTDEEIMDIGEACLHQTYIKWASNEKPDLNNLPVKFHKSASIARLEAVKARVKHLKATILERQI